MNKSIERMPLKDLQALVGKHLGHITNDPEQLLPWLSIAEYLKDAERWQYVLQHSVDLSLHMTPDQFKSYIDTEMGK